MKKLILICTVLLSAIAQAQTAEEIIQKFDAHLGGLNKFKNVQSFKMTGNITVQGMELPITMQAIPGKAVRTDVEVMGSSVVSAYKDGKGWKVNPFAGAQEPTDMTDKELADALEQTDAEISLISYKDKGASVELMGKETVQGQETYKIKYTPKSGGVPSFYYLNTATSALVKSSKRTEIMGTEMEIETLYSNVQEVDGLKFYLGMQQTAGGQELQDIRFDKIELNVPINEKIFDKP